MANFYKCNEEYKTVTGLWQYDYGQILRIQGLDLPAAVEIHFSAQESGGDSITRIGVTKDGVTDVVIPDSMLEVDTDMDYQIYAFVYKSYSESGETVYRIKMSVKSRPKPEAWSGSGETTAGQIMEAVNQIAAGKADGLEYKDNILKLLSGDKEIARVTIKAGSGSGTDAREIELQKGDAAIQWRYVGDAEWTDLISLAEITGPAGPAGAPGSDGRDGVDGQDGAPGTDGKDGHDGVDGITPHIGDNGNWYIGDTDTGKPSRGETGPAGQDGAPGEKGDKGDQGDPGYTPVKGVDYFDGDPGAPGSDGKSAYQYAQEGGFTGTEEEFISKLAAEYAEIVDRVEMTAEDTAVELQPNKLYVFPEMAELSLTFANPEDTTIANEYHCIFRSGATATTLTLPDMIQTGSFSVDANKTYELSVLENCLTWQSWDYQAEVTV